MSNDQPKALRWEDLRQGMMAAVDFTVTSDDMCRFQAVSGDCNPLHNDDAFARTKGFEGAVVFGALLVAKVSQFIGMELPGRESLWTRLSMDFHKPLYVGQAAQLEGVVIHLSDATHSVLLQLSVRRCGELLAKGKAEVLFV